nr:MAG TPA: glycoprotein [Caudoviricetes sp.]
MDVIFDGILFFYIFIYQLIYQLKKEIDYVLLFKYKCR